MGHGGLLRKSIVSLWYLFMSKGIIQYVRNYLNHDQQYGNKIVRYRLSRGSMLCSGSLLPRVKGKKYMPVY
jgi:hypothetical protein